MKFAPDEPIWQGNYRHEQCGRDFLKKHWLLPSHVKFVKHKDKDLIEIIAKIDLELEM